MHTSQLNTLFSGWERELLLLIETEPTQQEFWDYWNEREAAIDKVALPSQQQQIDDAFNRMFEIAEAHGYARLPIQERQ